MIKGPKNKAPWKKRPSVERLKFTLDKDNAPIEIGRRGYGKVYLGKIHFKGDRVPKNAAAITGRQGNGTGLR